MGGLPQKKVNEISGTGEIMNDLTELLPETKLEPSDNEELKRRIQKAIEYCKETDVRLGVETLCLAVGVSRQTFWRWSCGVDCSKERQEIVLQAKQLIAGTLEQMHLQGRLNPVSAIFLSKNWMGYTDKYEVENPANNASSRPEMSIEEIEADIPIDFDLESEDM